MNHIARNILPFFLFVLLLWGATSLASCRRVTAPAVNEERKKEISEQIYKYRRNEDSLNWFLNKSIQEKDNVGKLFSYRLLGNYQRENARFTEAISSHQNELETSLTLNDTIEIIQALNNLGTDFRRVGALTEASDYHYRALDYSEIFSKSDSPAGMKNKVVSLNGIGNVSLSLGYYDEAKSYFITALKDEKKLNSPIGQAINYANIGAIYEHTNNLDSARIYYERSLEQNIIGKSDMGIGLCYIHFGNIHKKQGEYVKAKTEYRKAYDLMEDISDRWHWLEACISIAEINFLTHNIPGYLHYIELAELVADEIESPEHLSQIYYLKHTYELSQNNFQPALANFKRSIIMQDSVQGVKKNSQYLDLRMSYERNKFNRSLREIEDLNKAEQDKRKIMLYVMLLTTLAGAVITGVLYYAYRQRTRSNAILRQLENTRSEFFTGITHEFRTPLTVILGLAEQMQNGSYDDSARSIVRQGTVLLDMVNQLLEMAKLKSRLDQSNWVNGDLVAFTNMCVESFRSYATTKSVDLLFVSNERVLNVDFIPNYLERIIVNLLSNALKHSPGGGRITLSLEHDCDNVLMRVSDTGTGIDPEDLPHIFKEFYTGKYKTHAASGSGIGLALVQKMMEAMNGRVSAENIPNSGAEFIVELPIRQKFEISEQWGADVKSDTSPVLAPVTDVSILVDDEPSDPENQKPSVLVVEDNPDIQNYIGTLLENKYQLRYASDGKEGLAKATEFLPDLIITDLMMPVMDGFELAQQIRRNNILNHIPIIVITAKTSDQDRQHAFESGADAYLFKPFNAGELQLRVAKLLEQRMLLREKYSQALLEGSSDEVELSADDRDFLNRIITVVHDHIADESLNADFIADNVYMSRSQLNRKIKQISGYSISAFILHIRLEKSKRMLRSGDDRIGDIAMACGFEDSNYYSRVFKQIYKMSPSQFRKTPVNMQGH